MTLRDLFDYLGQNPLYITGYFLLMPILALMFNWVSQEEGARSPWKYIYSVLVFATCVPGVFSVALSVYYFLFERGSIMNANILTQILPVLSMALTLAFIRRNVPMGYIPGSERISSLIILIGATIVLMYILDRTRLFVFVNLPLPVFLLVLTGLLVAMRFATKRMLR